MLTKYFICSFFHLTAPKIRQNVVNNNGQWAMSKSEKSDTNLCSVVQRLTPRLCGGVGF